MQLERKVLERRYLEMSRATHPDRVPDDPTAVTRSAQVNDAYRKLRDPWQRARALVDRADSQAMEQTKTLDPMFLMSAMENAEDVAGLVGQPEEKIAAKREALAQAVQESLNSITTALNEQRIQDAARALHEAQYSRKALADLNAAVTPKP